MASPTTDSNVARRMLGLTLETMRVKQGISRENAAEAIAVARSTLWKIETGQAVRLNPVLIKHLCDLYESDAQQAQVVLELVQETKAKGWWQAFAEDAIPKEFGLFVSLEDAAERITSYQTTLLPGLLHTADYRRALIRAEFPNKPTGDVERMLEVGMRRQQRLKRHDKPLGINAFIDETVLRRTVGGLGVMEGQLLQLADMAALDNVSIRVVPSSAGMYQALIVGSFVILEFAPRPTADLSMPPVVYVQGFLGDLYLEQTEEIRRYREVRTHVERIALDEKASRSLMLQVAKEYST
ncbi:helix-turn-helix domain-containing protein [Nocardia jiangxiensis]|uniref:helix-turn-helix domain-containing protein n=1 Tax=Nocardia jiangxiensis TaxID=282685 RepID=UPI000303E98E|nr:helix-turn-helix transcriptional regulator [Nocardia jiangxiensis]